LGGHDVKRLWRALGPCSYLLLSACFLIILRAFYSRVPLPRRETEVLSWELFTKVHRACGLQGSMTASYDHPPKPPDPWRFEVPLLVASNKIGGYPEAMFSMYCSFTVLIHMWFYNLVLKFNGLGYEQWIKLNFKPVVPSCLRF
jgi:hypothetical protein